MIFTFLITIVFIAELIIAIAIIVNLFKFSKNINQFNEIISLAKPKLKDIGELVVGITEHFVELTEEYINKYKKKEEDVALKILTKLLTIIILWKINSKTINKIRNSKSYKIIGKGLSLLENMV